jgi:zinc transporter ZupT
MDLMSQTAILVAGIISFSCLPLIFKTVKKHSQLFFLTGTGAMFGLCFFDLLPELFEKGGKSSLIIIALVLVVYIIIHKHHHKTNEEHIFSLFFVSLVLHCFASGLLLAISYHVSDKASHSIFITLFIHKCYEALMFSFILINRQFSAHKKALLLSAYALSLPLGIISTLLIKESMTGQLAVIISSISVGTLVGCLIFDFFIPSLRQIKHRRFEMVFIIFGLILTQLILRSE